MSRSNTFRSLCLFAVCLLASCNRAPDPKPAQSKPPASKPALKRGYNDAFWAHWGDGMAEMNGYKLNFRRYGQIRTGTAVAIFVNETFARSLAVKSDPGRRSAADEMPVMKMNLVKNYQTGIYNYSEMTSVFTALVPTPPHSSGWPAKISFSSQEWCGHVYGQVLFQLPRLSVSWHSYFDGEADSLRQIEVPSTATSEDALSLWARKIGLPYTKPGTTEVWNLLTSLETARAQHLPLIWNPVKLQVQNQAQNVTVPAGKFSVEVRTATWQDGFKRTFYVEKTFPHRLVMWETSAGEWAQLLGSDRMKYWELNREGGEEALKRMGLTRRGPLMP